MERHNYKYVRHDTGRNPGYPGKYSVSGDCEWKINKLSDDICQIRLDFETMEIADPNGNNINSTSLFLSLLTTMRRLKHRQEDNGRWVLPSWLEQIAERLN